MCALQSRYWTAIAFVFCFLVPVARADVITPDSIANPPAAVGSGDGTSVFANNLVTTQYASLGLNFPGGSAITNLNGVNVWAPTETLMQPQSRIAGGPSPTLPAAQISYLGSWAGASFVTPGSLNPTMVSSFSVQIVGHPLLSITVSGLNGQVLNIAPTITFTANGEIWTFTGSGISSFSAIAAVIDPPPGAAPPHMPINPAWGVSEISFTPAHAPEPSSLVLAGLGVLGFVGRCSWRRIRRAVA